MPSVTDNSNHENQQFSSSLAAHENSMDSISNSIVVVYPDELKESGEALESLLNKVKTPLCRNALERLISLLKGTDSTLLANPSEIYKDLIQSLDKEPELDHPLVYKALGLNAELNGAPDLDDLIKGKIAGFNQKKLLEMCTFSKITYGDVDRKLKKDKYKTKRQFEEAGYQIIKFYDNELIQDKYCSDNGYKLEQHNVGYALTGNNSYTRDAGYVFIKDKKDKIEVTIAYHGTRDLNDVKEDLRASLAKLSFLPEDNHVHSGFYSLFKRSWPNVHKILQGHANDKGLAIKDLKINVTGHSMGGALATIAALCLEETEGAKDVHVATFGSPRVLYQDAAEVYSKYLGEKTIRVACQSDPVPCLPFGSGGTAYKHVGKPLRPETDKYVDYPEGFYHKLDTYYNLIQKIKQKGFTSDDSTSKYLILTYALRLFPSFLQMVSSNGELNNKEFFEKVKEENKDIKLSEIPIEYAPKLEEKLKQAEQERDEFNGRVTKLTEKSSQLREEFDTTKTQLTEREKELDDTKQDLSARIQTLESTQAQLEQEHNSAKQKLDKTTEELESTQAQLTDKVEEISKVNDQVTKLTEKSSQLREEFDTTKTQLAEKEKELNSTNQDLVNKTSEVTRLTKELNGTKDQLEENKKELSTVNRCVLQLEQEKSSQQARIDGLTKERDQLTSKADALTENLENKSKELNGKNEKFLGASTHSKRQGNYASASFVLSGAFAVGASLTIPYLAICIALAVAASTFLAIGCYCSYKANTALNNVEVEVSQEIPAVYSK